MQIHKYMTKTLQFMYYMILFISLLFVEKNINGNIFFILFKFSYLVLVCTQSFNSF